MWSQNWGSMIWGSAHVVPVMGPLGLMLLAMGLMVSGSILLRNPTMRRLMGVAMVLLGLLVPISTFAVPFAFTNGTVADATQVNQNGSVQAGVFAASVCPSGAQQIFIITRPQNQDGGSPGQDRAFYLLVN